MDLVVDPDLSGWQWKDEDEYAHVRRLGIVADTEHQAVDAAAWTSWRWNQASPAPQLPRPGKAMDGVAPTDG
ncbi:hypothetical protein [Streptomyces chryseus]